MALSRVHVALLRRLNLSGLFPVLQGLAPPPPTAAVSKAMTEAIPCAQASPVTELQQPPAPVLLQSYSSYCS